MIEKLYVANGGNKEVGQRTGIENVGDITYIGRNGSKQCSKKSTNISSQHSYSRQILGGFFITCQDLKESPVNLYIHEGCGA